jgi:hypothetical protein
LEYWNSLRKIGNNWNELEILGKNKGISTYSIICQLFFRFSNDLAYVLKAHGIRPAAPKQYMRTFLIRYVLKD